VKAARGLGGIASDGRLDATAHPSHPCPGEGIEAPLNPDSGTGLNHFFFSLFSFRFSFRESWGFFFFSFLLSRFP
jgi:hypothetical protein